MSDQRGFKWKSGRLTSTPINDGWAIDRDTRDPSIPNLPLETFVTAVANGIIALCFGYAEAAPAVEIEDSFTAQVIEAPAAVQEDIAWYVVTDPVEDDDTPDSVSEPLPMAVLAGENPPIDAVVTEILEEDSLEDCPSWLLIEDAEVADLTQIPPPVLTEPEEGPDIEDALITGVVEDAAVADLTFVPGWQDDFLADYQQQRDDDAEFTILATVFDPYGQVDEPPPVVPGEGAYIPPFRRRRR